ncbi:trimeric LpxA-like protein [Baffinella frigidus]|nr:trimeric LpxA-like protein [Cryptophyta sp. CCMP2293]
MPFLEIYPGIAVDSFVAPNVTVIGDVMISHRVIVSYGCVIRGDENVVSIFPGTVIQENCVITADAAVSNMSLDTDGQGGRVADFPGEVVIECSVQIGPGCVLRACKVEMEAVIGAGSILCEGSIVEEGAVLEPGSVVPPGRRVPAGTQWGGNPIKYIRDVESWDVCSSPPRATVDWTRKACTWAKTGPGRDTTAMGSSA